MLPQTYVVLDLETTGLDHKKDQIIEIGAIKIRLGGRFRAYEEVSRFHTMVALEEDRDLPEFITKLTGITEEELEDAPEEWDALDDLKPSSETLPLLRRMHRLIFRFLFAAASSRNVSIVREQWRAL